MQAPCLRRRAVCLSLLVATCGLSAAVATACSDDASGTSPTLDAGPPLALDGSGGGPEASASDEAGPGPADAATGAPDADAGDPTPPTTCKTLHEKDPSLPSGIYAIDLDGAGTIFPALQVYCDMAFDGGGWTMIQSYTGGDSPASLAGPGDSGVLVASPEPGKLGGLADWIVRELAERSSQVHIRLSFASDAGADGGTWVTSRAPDAGARTNVIANLRNLDVLNKNTDGGFAEWAGPSATAARLAWEPYYGGTTTVCLDPVHATKYPSIYWACGNFTSMNIYGPQALCRWEYQPNTANQPMEVFVR